MTWCLHVLVKWRDVSPTSCSHAHYHHSKKLINRKKKTKDKTRKSRNSFLLITTSVSFIAPEWVEILKQLFLWYENSFFFVSLYKLVELLQEASLRFNLLIFLCFVNLAVPSWTFGNNILLVWIVKLVQSRTLSSYFLERTISLEVKKAFRQVQPPDT